MGRPKSKTHRLSIEHLENRYLLASVTVEPTIDNSLYEDDLGVISNGAGRYLFAGKTGPRADEKLRRALLKFSVADQVPEGAVVTSASLQLHVSRSKDAEVYTMSLHRLLSGWGEGSSAAPDPEGEGTTATNGDATWVHREFPSDNWEMPGGDFVTVASSTTEVGADGFYSWSGDTLVNDVADWLSQPEDNFGWIVLGNETELTTAKRFDSRESLDAANRPQLTIEFEQPASPAVSIGAAAVIEGDQGTSVLGFAVTLSEPAREIVTVQFATQDGDATADDDYLSLSGVVTFEPGGDRQMIEVEVLGDLTTESDETLTVVLLEATNAEIATDRANGIIENDDPQPTLTGEAASFPEMSDVPPIVNLVLSNPSSFPIQVSYVTVSDTAEAGDDFVQQEGVAAFAPGETTQSVELTILDDDDVEDDETFRIEFSDPVSALIGGPLNVTIEDDDEPSIGTPWQNSAFPEDVNGDGFAVPLDALLIINALNAGEAGPLPPATVDEPPPYFDVDGDNQLAPIDAQLVINFINAPRLARLDTPTTAQDVRDIAAAIDLVLSMDELRKHEH